MATRTIYLTVRLDIDNPKVDEITDEEVDEIISENRLRIQKIRGLWNRHGNLRTK